MSDKPRTLETPPVARRFGAAAAAGARGAAAGVVACARWFEVEGFELRV